MMNEDKIMELYNAYDVQSDIYLDAYNAEPTTENHNKLLLYTKVAAVLRQIVED